MGGVIIRIFDPRIERYSYIVWIHAVLQGVGYVLFIAAAGMGIYMGKHLHAVSSTSADSFNLVVTHFECPADWLVAVGQISPDHRIMHLQSHGLATSD